MLDAKFFINELVTLSIALAFFIGILYVIVKIEHNPIVINWMRRKSYMYLIYFLIGILVGLISVVLNLIQKSLNTEYSFVVDVAFILVCGFFTSPLIFTGSTIIYTLSSFLFNMNASADYQILLAYALLIYIFMCIVLIILKVLTVSRFWVFYLIAIPTAIVSLAFGWLFVPKNFWEIWTILPFLTLAYILVYYLLGVPVVNFIGRTKKLSEAINFSPHHFVLSAHANDYLLQNIKNINARRGLFIVFNFKGSHDIQFRDGVKKYNEIIAPLLEMIKSKFDIVFPNTKSLWFLSKLNYHAVFVPIQDINEISLDAIYAGNNSSMRAQKDIFNRCEKVFKNIPQRMQYEDQIYHLKIQVTGAVYGLHSSNFDKLSSMSEILMSQYEKNRYSNLIHVYNPNDFKSIESDAELYSDLMSKLNIESIKTELNLLKCAEEPKTNFYYGFHAIPEKLILNKWMILNEVLQNETKSTLIRLFAIRSIKAFNEKFQDSKNNKKLIIDFPTYQLNASYFSITDIMIKLENYGVQLNKLIMNIGFDMEHNSGLTPVAIQNIESLKKKGIKFSVSGFIPNNLDVFNDIDVDYVIGNNLVNFDVLKNKDYEKSVSKIKDIIANKKIKILYLKQAQ